MIASPPAAWSHLPFFTRDWPAIAQRLSGEQADFAPAPDRIFRALDMAPPDRVRVVILGQDPYPTPGNADGLAFSVPADRPLPASLRNIFTEMRADIGRCPESGDLSGWARQGVLLLNSALTVPHRAPGGHARIGWDRLLHEVLDEIAAKPAAFLLWGRPAQTLAAPHLVAGRHLAVATPHPSPLSAYRGFFGSRPFSRVNAWLADRSLPPVDWACGPG